MTGGDMVISVKDLTKKFGNFTAVDHISFDVKKGEIFGFLGANGAGKTTAMRMLCGLSFPTSGDGKVDGYDIITQSEDVKKHIGYMSQKFSLYENLTVAENVRLFCTIYGMSNKEIKQQSSRLFTYLDMVGMEKKLVKDIPVGWKQKLAFSVATMHNPAVVFLDEPTGGVDPITRRKFWELIYEVSSKGMTVFVTTHYLDEAEYCDRISIMVDGKIAALNSPEGLKQEFHVETMDEVFRKVASQAKRTE
ncbi:MAG: ABC transporter ATP-binding protein [Muribaculaceae bacterium]|nr:ABC transporter ATP-binding protein [Muribaculaceae bacterium]